MSDFDPHLIRTVGMETQAAIDAVYLQLHSLRYVSRQWTLACLNQFLPDPFEIKTVVAQYQALKFPRLEAQSAVAVMLTAQPEDGIADAPAYCGPFVGPGFDGVFETSAPFVAPFRFDGPVWAGQSVSQAFGLELTLQVVSLFVLDTGTGGDALTIDLRLAGVSILTEPITIAADSGANVTLVVPALQLTTFTIPGAGVVSAHLLTVPTGAAGVTVNWWMKIDT